LYFYTGGNQIAIHITLAIHTAEWQAEQVAYCNTHLLLECVVQPAEQHEGVVLSLDLCQPPALTHRQRSIRRIIAQATAATAA
jgi:hypothetical protein